ncbi:hypothetical protein [Sideroxydans lithotrophicus]|uniref:Uncharacterized protein n=1 Tax=Sideroxydans lithotrophicus (strain ES-1) TaxID=580332 RepID=D5CT57_SIDLE|nr:hypothetical protein [Sideroxydans lithotrophicus]ADE12143.1 conserved hypothetical protein [Sideroxydans lithotrophicus ES-1]
MKIYLPHYDGKPTHNVFVQPGREYPNSAWMDENGKPRMFAVEFRYGRAEVADNLGQYMLDKELAQSSPIIVIERKVA